MITITLPDANDFVVSVTLDGEVFRLHFAWNDTGAFWSMGIRNDKDNIIIERIRCVPNYPLLAQYRRPTLPKGEVLCITSSNTVGRNDFASGKAKLVYVPEAELDGAI